MFDENLKSRIKKSLSPEIKKLFDQKPDSYNELYRRADKISGHTFGRNDAKIISGEICGLPLDHSVRQKIINDLLADLK